MGRVNFVPAVDIGGQQPMLLAELEALDLVCGCVGPEHELGVEIVGVALPPTGMVDGEAELVEVLVRRDDGIWISEKLEAGELAGDGVLQDLEWMAFLLVKVLAESAEKGVGQISHAIHWEGAGADLNQGVIAVQQSPANDTEHHATGAATTTVDRHHCWLDQVHIT